MEYGGGRNRDDEREGRERRGSIEREGGEIEMKRERGEREEGV